MKLYSSLIVGCAILMWSHFAHSDELRIASWNIANLAEPGSSIRLHKREQKDYDDLVNKIRQLRPDIIALQEIGSVQAAEHILGSDYTVKFESRCYGNTHKCSASDGNIYTAIAFHKKLDGRATFFQVDSLAVDHTDECGRTNKLRGGVGIKIDIGGRPAWVLSVHMKAACKHDYNPDPDVQDDCEAQQRQFEALRSWMMGHTNDVIIVAGDLNRLLLNPKDRIRRSIFESISTSVRVLPEKNARKCWQSYNFGQASVTQLQAEARQNNPEFVAKGITPKIYLPREQKDLDYFVVINASADAVRESTQDEMSGSYRFESPGETLKTCQREMKVTNIRKNEVLTFGRSYPSDHCPILLELND